MDWLLEHGAIVAITDAGALARAGMNLSFGIPEGWPDLTCCLPGGAFLGIECKSDVGRQSKAQKTCQERIEFNGGLYFCVHSLEELIKKFG